MAYVILGLVVVTLGIGVLAWYYKRKATSATARAEASETAAAALKSVNGELRASLERTLAGVAQKHEQEKTEDAHTAHDAALDPQLAADLLNSMHKDRPGGGPVADVPARPVPAVP